MQIEKRQQQFLMRFCRLNFFLSTGIAALSLLGWVAGASFVTSYRSSYIPIAPSSALLLLLLSGVLLIYMYRPDHRVAKISAAAVAFVTLAVCSLLLAGYFLRVSFMIESLGLHSPGGYGGKFPVGHMSPITATALILASTSGLVLVLLSARAAAFGHAAGIPGMVVALIGFVVSLGYMYGTPLLYGGQMIPMAFPTAAACLFLGIGLVAAPGPLTMPAAAFTGPSVRSRLMRYFLPTVIVIFLIQDVVSWRLLRESGNPALLSAVTVILTVFIVGLAIERIAMKVGGAIDQAIAERNKAEADREKLIAELQDALASVKTLSGMLPICASCKKIRDDTGYWEDVASYITRNSDLLFSHGYCPDCAKAARDEFAKFKAEVKRERATFDR